MGLQGAKSFQKTASTCITTIALFLAHSVSPTVDLVLIKVPHSLLHLALGYHNSSYVAAKAKLST